MNGSGKMDGGFHVIAPEELAQARFYFENNPPAILEKTARQFNAEQPFFTAAAYAWQAMGMPDHAVEELLQSIFEAYYAVRVLQRRRIKEIGKRDIEAGTVLFGEFNEFYKASDFLRSNKKLVQTAFLKNAAVFDLSVSAMDRSFADVDSLLQNKEGLILYHSVLRAIEVAKSA